MAWGKRSLIESLERRKDMMVAALWANSGIEAEGRRQVIDEIENNFEDAVQMINADQYGQSDEEVVDENNEFFAAAKRGVAKIEAPKKTDGTVKEVIDYTEGIDQ